MIEIMDMMTLSLAALTVKEPYHPGGAKRRPEKHPDSFTMRLMAPQSKLNQKKIPAM
jgi:hypothetical protein